MVKKKECLDTVKKRGGYFSSEKGRRRGITPPLLFKKEFCGLGFSPSTWTKVQHPKGEVRL